jgi:hypothetical protein
MGNNMRRAMLYYERKPVVCPFLAPAGEGGCGYILYLTTISIHST